MTPLRQVRSLVRSSLPPPAETARLELLEYFLIHHDDLQRCAQASLEWLDRHAGVKRSVSTKKNSSVWSYERPSHV